MNICVSVNSKYMRYLYVMLTSLYKNNSEEKVVVYVFQRDLTDEDKLTLEELTAAYNQKIVFFQISGEEFECFPTTVKFSMEAYFRLKILDLIPKMVDRVLYLDVDIIVRGSLRDLYNVDLGEHYFAACQCMLLPILTEDRQKSFNRYDDLRYFNSGVMVWNLKLIRENVTFYDFVEGGKRLGFDLQYADQEILNYLYYDKTLYLNSYVYNYLVMTELSGDKVQENESYEPLIYHYCGYNPWQCGPKPKKYSEWWEYAKLTPYYEELVREQLERTEEYVVEMHNICNSYEKGLAHKTYMADTIELLCELKGANKFREHFDESNRQYYIYGAGKMAEMFCAVLEYEGMLGLIKGVIDKNKKGEFHGYFIYNSVCDCKLDNADVGIIMTISFDIYEIINSLREQLDCEVEIISLKDYLSTVAGR